MITLYLYGTENCHLCEEAEKLVQSFIPFSKMPIKLAHRDIIENDTWYELYETKIPVLENAETGVVINWPFTTNEIINIL